MGLPSPPKIEGLPTWLQVIAMIAFGFATLIFYVRGYLKGPNIKPAGETAQIVGASIADMGAIRALNDTSRQVNDSTIRLGEKIDSLESALRENIHFRREGNELNRELCARLRELKERLEAFQRLVP